MTIGKNSLTVFTFIFETETVFLPAKYCLLQKIPAHETGEIVL